MSYRQKAPSTGEGIFMSIRSRSTAACLTRLAQGLALCAALPAQADSLPVLAEASAVSAAGASNSNLSTLDKVTVTARRRDEDAQDVPIPITTLSGDALEKDGTFRLENLNQKFPSTNVQFSNPRQSSIAVRGLGNNPANDALESSVGVYLDNVYLGRSSMANLDLVDIDQVALVEGPQGTLFGKNTNAGVLNISTRLPTFTPETIAEVSGGENSYYQARFATSGALIENKLAARVSAATSRVGGFVKDVVDGRELNGNNRLGTRAQLLYVPFDKLSVRLIGDYNQEKSSCCVSVPYNLGPVVTANINGTPTQIQTGLVQPTRAGAKPVPIYDPEFRTTTLNSWQFMEVRQGGVSAEANWTLPNDYKLTSITAYRSWWFHPTNDGDSSAASAIVNAGQAVDDRQISQELRIASPTGKYFDYVAGFFYFYQYQDNLQYTYFGPDANAYNGIPAAAPTSLNNVVSLLHSTPTTNSASLFAQGTFHATSKLDLTAGLRETYETKATLVQRYAPIVPAGGKPAPATFAPYNSGSQDLTNYNLSALLSASYDVTKNVLLYTSFARGAKSGGINATVPPLVNGQYQNDKLFVAPETAKDAELGFKTEWFRRRLIWNANAYYTLVKNYQATGLVEVPPGSGNFAQVLTNVGWVRTQGVETTLQAIPVRGLNLSVAASYNDARYRSYPNAPCTLDQAVAASQASKTSCTQDLTGAAVVGAPKWSINPSVTGNYTIAGIHGYSIASYAWRSSFFGAVDDSERARVKPYGLVNLRTGTTGAIGNTNWDLSVWANNLFDRHYVVGGLTGGFAPTQVGSYSLTPGNPRIVGATLRLDF